MANPEIVSTSLGSHRHYLEPAPELEDDNIMRTHLQLETLRPWEFGYGLAFPMSGAWKALIICFRYTLRVQDSSSSDNPLYYPVKSTLTARPLVQICQRFQYTWIFHASPKVLVVKPNEVVQYIVFLRYGGRIITSSAIFTPRQPRWVHFCCSKRATRVTKNAVIIWVYILQHTPPGIDV